MNINAIKAGLEADAAIAHLDSSIHDAKVTLQRHRDSGDIRGIASTRELAQSLGALVRAVEHAEHIRQEPQRVNDGWTVTLTEQHRIDRARTILATEGWPESRSSFDGPGDIARLSAALRDMIALVQP